MSLPYKNHAARGETYWSVEDLCNSLAMKAVCLPLLVFVYVATLCEWKHVGDSGFGKGMKL